MEWGNTVSDKDHVQPCKPWLGLWAVGKPLKGFEQSSDMKWLYLNITLAAVWKTDYKRQEWKQRGQLFVMVFDCPEPFEPCCVWPIFSLMNCISLILIPSFLFATRTPACKPVFWTRLSNQKHQWRCGFWTEQTCLLAKILPMCTFQTTMKYFFPVFLVQRRYWRGRAVLVFFTWSFWGTGIYCWLLGHLASLDEDKSDSSSSIVK